MGQETYKRLQLCSSVPSVSSPTRDKGESVGTKPWPGSHRADMLVEGNKQTDRGQTNKHTGCQAVKSASKKRSEADGGGYCK